MDDALLCNGSVRRSTQVMGILLPIRTCTGIYRSYRTVLQCEVLNYQEHQRQLEQKKTELKEELPGKRKNEGGYLTIKGEEHICDKIIDMLLQAEERAYISVYNERLEMFREYLEKMVSEGKKVVIITNEPFELKGATVYLTQCKKEQIRLITDSKDVLTGAITNRYEATSLYSSNNNLVEVFKDALANEIQLLKMQ